MIPRDGPPATPSISRMKAERIFPFDSEDDTTVSSSSTIISSQTSIADETGRRALALPFRIPKLSQGVVTGKVRKSNSVSKQKKQAIQVLSGKHKKSREKQKQTIEERKQTLSKKTAEMENALTLADVDMNKYKTCSIRRLYRFPLPTLPPSQLFIGDAHLRTLDPEVRVGFTFCSKDEAVNAGVHRAQVAGIHYGFNNQRQPVCESICVSGAYEDNLDMGESLIFSGQGGIIHQKRKIYSHRVGDFRTVSTPVGKKDQELKNANLSLINAKEHQSPVRVLRGFKSVSEYAPAWGYRYDGLYLVTDMKEDTGDSGKKVFRFFLKRIFDQEDPPWWKQRRTTAT